MNSHRHQYAYLPLVLAAVFSASSVWADEADEADDRWESEIRGFEQQDKETVPRPGGVVFVGSSSIRMWDLPKYFPGLKPANRGFGGSEIADSVRYADRILGPRKPRTIVLYAGDNDLANGKKPEQLRDDFQAFVAAARKIVPEAKILYLAIKPSLARQQLIPQVREANRLIAESMAGDDRLVFVDVFSPMLDDRGEPRAELLADDKLHLSPAGYEVWTATLKPHLGE